MKRIVSLCLILCSAITAGAQQTDYPIQPVPFTSVKMTDRFWAPRIKKNHEVTIPIALKHCYNTGRIENFLRAAKWKEGPFCSEYPFDDSDVFKIIEGAAFSLQTMPDPEMEAHIDALIYYIGAAQEPDGYLYTNRTINPDSMHVWVDKERWKKTWDLSHELYNIGHMYEAAVAYYQATGKRELLDIAIKSADLVCKDFGPGGLTIVPGHQVIEMGLVKLYRVTNDKKYLDMAHRFLEFRGHEKEHTRGEYCQDHLPVADQNTAVGHSVRACYMYAGMADIAAITGHAPYLHALNKIWSDIVDKKYYLTGGIGAAAGHEGFGPDYDLPNLTAYNETCASISKIFWNQRMFLLEGDAKFYDIVERTLYNGTISGVSLTADHFFYPNPLESSGRHARSEWFGCACCPSNICRFIPSVPGYIYAQNGDRLYVNLFAQSEASIQLNGKAITITQQTDYPWDGSISIKPQPQQAATFEMAIRIPGWVRNEVVPSDLYTYMDKPKSRYTLTVNGKAETIRLENGYAIIKREWKKGDEVVVNFPMEVRKVASSKKVEANQNRFALERGPIVYCLEEIDNPGESIREKAIPKNTTFTTRFNPNLLEGVQVIEATGKNKETITAIPYYSWANRGKGEMTVWIPFK